tara:strand:- start:116 stop:859 length:744 start_codon:yes stop_codon:yes gene_type:complete
MKYSKIKYYIYILLISLIFSDSPTNNGANEILKSIMSRYNQDISFKIMANVNKTKTEMDVDMVWLGEDTVDVNRKTWIQLIEPKDLEGVNVWIWNLNNGKIKTWATRPGSGKKFEISNKKNNMGLDLSFIQLDESILDGINVISDTLSYNDRDCYVVDFYKMRKSRKVGPISKFWIDADNYNIHKIQKFDKRGRMLSEAIFEEYSDINFPKKLIISDTKKKTKTSIDIDYDDKTDFNLDNFNPRDIE